MRKTLLEQWDELEKRIDEIDAGVVERYFDGAERPVKFYRIGFAAGFRVIKELVITKWGVSGYNHDKRTGAKKPYREFTGSRYKNPTAVKVAEFVKYVKQYNPMLEDVGFGYEETWGDGNKSTGFMLALDMNGDKSSFNAESLQGELDRLKDLYDPKEGHVKCEYCGRYRKPEDIRQGTIISPNWRRNNFRSPLRNYCKDGDCHGNDQMAHEG